MKRWMIGVLTAALLAACVIPGRMTETYAAERTFADADEDVVSYPVDGGWASFNTRTGTLTWWPKEAEGDVAVPDNFDGIPVKAIGEWAFYKHDKVTSVALPASVEAVEEGAFWGCTLLQAITGFDNVRSVGSSAFKDCGSLKTISTYDNIRSIGLHAFEGCDSLGNLIVPASSYNEPAVTENVSRQIYSDLIAGEGKYYSGKVTSYLYREGDFWWRVECSGVISIEKYTKDFAFVEGRTLETDLMKIWGGFFCGSKYNFILTGDYNYEENSKKPVITIDKYSKDWQKLQTLELNNGNTVEPFRSTAVRFAEYGKYLYIHTANRMYKAADGYNHQTNTLLQINEEKMKLMDSIDKAVSHSSGTVSHSFNQFILIDSKKNIITLDHGDASPRSIVLFKNGKKAGKKKFTSKKGTMLEIYKIPEYKGDEDFGYNMTGVSLGGLEETGSGYVTVYASDEKGGNAGEDSVKNIFLTYTPKSGFSENATKTKKLTSYGKNSTERVGTPQIVSEGPDGGYILWDIIKDGAVSGQIAYAHYDAAGNVSEAKTAEAFLSDCKPVWDNGEVVWYVTRNSVPEFYHLSENGM